MKNKKALTTMGQIMAWTIAFVVISTLTYGILNPDAEGFLDILIPDFLMGETSEGEVEEDYTADSTCPRIAIIGINNKVEFCNDQECENPVEVNIEISGSSVLVDKIEVGNVYGDDFWIDPKVIVKEKIEQDSKLYLKIKNSIELINLLKIHEAKLTGSNRKTICKKKPTPTLEEHRLENFQVIREKGIEGEARVPGPIYYYNVDDLIKNKNKATTPLYLDKELTDKALSSVNPNGKVQRVPESFEAKFQPSEKAVTLISPRSKLTIEAFRRTHEGGGLDLEVNGKSSDIFKIDVTSPYLDNPNNKRGIDSGGDDFTHIQYVKSGGEVYLKLLDFDYVSDVDKTPFIRLDYWEAYHSFIWAPDWASAWDKTR